MDYALSSKDRLSAKYYVQNDPTSNPFGAVGSLLGFPQQLSAGSQVISIGNTIILSPTLTWEQHVGFTRLRAFAATSQAFTPSSMGISLPGAATFPQFEIGTSDPTISDGLRVRPQHQLWPCRHVSESMGIRNLNELGKRKTHDQCSARCGTTRSSISSIDNINTDTLHFTDFGTFVEGAVRDGDCIRRFGEPLLPVRYHGIVYQR